MSCKRRDVQALRSFSLEEQGAFLRFVTSVSRGPLLGFRYLEPPLCIQVGCVQWCSPCSRRSRPLLCWLGGHAQAVSIKSQQAAVQTRRSVG